MTRSIDNINLCILVLYRYVFGSNGNSTFTFQIIIIQNKISCIFVFTKKLTVIHNLVYQGRFAVVYVGNNRNIFNRTHSGVFYIFSCKKACKGTFIFNSFYNYYILKQKIRNTIYEVRSEKAESRKYEKGFLYVFQTLVPFTNPTRRSPTTPCRIPYIRFLISFFYFPLFYFQEALGVTTRVVLYATIPRTSFQSGCGISTSITHAKNSQLRTLNSELEKLSLHPNFVKNDTIYAT